VSSRLSHLDGRSNSTCKRSGASASPFPSLAAAWSRAGPPPDDLVERTRENLATVQPSDLAEVAGLVEVLAGRAGVEASRAGARRALFTLLDTARRRFFTEALAPGEVEPWTRLLVGAVERADYTFGDVLRSREDTDPRTVAMRVLGADACELSVADVARRTRAIARGLLALLRDDPEPRVAILSDNCLEAALCDLACLSNGIVDFPLPANAVPEQLVWMVRHSGARVLLCSDEEQLSKVLPSLGATALQAGRHAGATIGRLLAGKPAEPFHYLDKGSMAQLGRGAAIAQLPGGETFTGHLAWIAWLGVHLALLNGAEERTSTLVDWGWNYVTHGRSKRIRLRVNPGD
jgi:hypothetical protein